MIVFLALGVACVFALAAANGANDLSRAAATLLGGRVASYRGAMLWTAAWTLCGSLASGVLAAGMAARFAAVMPHEAQGSLIAVAAAPLAGAFVVVIATARRLPISTTHAVLGGLLGVALSLGHDGSAARLGLGRSFVLPLLTSPVLALTLAFLLRPIVRSVTRLVARKPAPKALDRAHWISGGFVAFSRGVNDSAKIWALMLPFGALAGLSVHSAVLAGQMVTAAAMLVGGVLFGRRVAETLAFRIRTIEHEDSAVANVVTAAVILGASRLGLPVASSHVVAGAILGVGLSDRHSRVSWATVTEMGAAWVMTLPSAAAISFTIATIGRAVPPPGARAALIAAGAIAVIAVLLARKIDGLRQAATPAALAAAVSMPARLLIFVCNSNTSRSPMAERICASLLQAMASAASSGPRAMDRLTIVSRGLTASPGAPLAAGALAALTEFGVEDASSHSSRNLLPEEAAQATEIYCMTEKQLELARQRFPAYADRIFRLDPQHDIPDPSGLDQHGYHDVALRIRNALTSRLTDFIPVLDLV